ncbi:hypothetical protein A3H85_02905 [Candidatus Daviesbacteria bacterium RIFCSPLOWO2_02_FULL_40_8]|uniref:Uncharacterized protein n=1 Tax=Candidatus Daviesbacteria bacterium RIFCSPLOWO2_01_FULL_40_24 TaxID=1797787 RepID=A0A1F5MKE8_9BACT|nr:MAG: hypothetical protein A2780_01110 [Candidatus Daviesbacteria bacterium RIFCSPHIGHO2_01_FULL_41_45]OGE65851.1 MAG: hypothetical protein A3B49_03270 [Candidatus Daviesbacteria bacterium RIFCSPLOWO2_01_FULL_40_24]OGE67001.1 MAG: hypothetical protein A3H85_02905 [Candidatus Daviesbacteria bacterium RIFCSPLOWO2_02_FULL_40_8]
MKQIILSLIISLFLFIPNVYASILPEGTISSISPSSCADFPCSVSISWNVTNNPDGEGVELSNNGSVLSSGASGSQNFTISSASNIVLNVGSTQVDSKSLGLVVPTATPTPAPKTCNQDCGGLVSCVSGLSCISGKCRLPSYPNESSCQAPSYPEYRSCNQSCGGGNQQCLSGLSCINNVCRHPQNPNDTSCSAPAGASSATAVTPTKSPISGSVLGSKSSITAIISDTSEATSAGEILGTQIDDQPTSISEANPPQQPGLMDKIKSNPLPAVILLGGLAALGFSLYKLKKG